MPLVPHPTPGSVIASDWGSSVADQLVMTFPTAAARASALPTPIVGQTTARGDAPGLLEVWNGTAWIAAASNPSVGWSSYTPVWTIGGSSSGLTIGAGGTLSGFYKMIAPYTLALVVYFNPGTSGFAGGSGQWAFSIPVGYTYTGFAPVTSYALLTSTGPPFVGATYLSGANTMSPATTGAAGQASNWWSATFPVTWANAHGGRFGMILPVTQRW